MTLVGNRPKKNSLPPNSHLGEVLCCGFAPNGKAVYSGGWDGEVIQWGLDGQIHRRWKAGERPITAIAVSPDSGLILTGSMEGLLARWDMHTLQPAGIFLAHTRPISAIVFSPDGKRIATSSWDRSIGLWTASGEGGGRFLRGHDDIVSGCAFLPHGKELVSWSFDGSFRVWDLDLETEVQKWSASADRVLAGAVSPDGRWFAGSVREGSIILWDAAGARQPVHCSFAEGEVRCCFFSSDAEWLATVNTTGEIVCYSLPDFSTRSGMSNVMQVQCAQASVLGEHVAVGTESGRVHVFTIDLFASRASCVTAVESYENRPGRLRHWLGKTRMQWVKRIACPACGHSQELIDNKQVVIKCTDCSRPLRINDFVVKAIGD